MLINSGLLKNFQSRAHKGKLFSDLSGQWKLEKLPAVTTERHLLFYLQSTLEHSPLLRTLSLSAEKIQIPGNTIAMGVWLEMTPAITKLWTLSCDQNDNHIVLDKADSMPYVKLESAIHHLPKCTSRNVWNVLYFWSSQQSLLHRHCSCYLLYVKGTYYGLSSLRTLHDMPELVRYDDRGFLAGGCR